jgi:hypothetical protein
MRVLPLGAYDAVLGMDWLESHSPMTVDWVLKFMEVPCQGKMVCLQAMLPKQATSLAMISVTDVHKAYKGNDIWALAVVDFVTNTSEVQDPSADSLPSTQLDPALSTLLQEFGDVFEDPKSLPPHRSYDHAIDLEPNAARVNSRPYRYSPLQKDEIERQIAEMIQTGKMDFIEGLPKSEGFEVILVVVDRLTKYAHFIPLRHPYTTSTVANLFLDTIIRLYGVPLSIVSDRDKVFTSNFWRELFTAVGTKLCYSTAYRPQTNGQSEWVNQCLEHYLSCAVHDCPGKWKRWLAMAEFWYNSSYHTSLGCSPFKALYGIDPNFGALPNLGVVATPTIQELAEERQIFLQSLREHLLRAQARIKAYADKHRTEREFQVGDDALLKLQPYAQTSLVNRSCAKLVFKYFGTFKIVQRIGAVAYKLELPPDCAIHLVFHVSQLKPFTPNYTPVYDKLPAPPDIIAPTMRPHKILERRLVKKGNATVPQIRVQWGNLSP